MVEQLKHSAYGAKLVSQNVPQVHVNASETAEVKSVHSILCLIIEGIRLIIALIIQQFK